MLYNVLEMLGNVVTLKTVKGDEIIAKLIGFDEETDTLTLEYPKIVVVAGDTVALAPFALTARADLIITEGKQFLAVMESLKSTVSDYNALIEEQKKLESLQDTDVEEEFNIDELDETFNLDEYEEIVEEGESEKG